MPMSGAARSASISGLKRSTAAFCRRGRASGFAEIATWAISGRWRVLRVNSPFRYETWTRQSSANPAHDLVRLGLSLAMAARGSDLPGVTTSRMLERMIEGYEAAFAPDELGETLDTTEEMPRTVRRVMRAAANRS